MRSRKSESAFCLEAVVESVKHVEGEPASAILREGDRDNQKIEAFLPYLHSGEQEASFSMKGESLTLLQEMREASSLLKKFSGDLLFV